MIAQIKFKAQDWMESSPGIIKRLLPIKEYLLEMVSLIALCSTDAGKLKNIIYIPIYTE